MTLLKEIFNETCKNIVINNIKGRMILTSNNKIHLLYDPSYFTFKNEDDPIIFLFKRYNLFKIEFDQNDPNNISLAKIQDIKINSKELCDDMHNTISHCLQKQNAQSRVMTWFHKVSDADYEYFIIEVYRYIMKHINDNFEIETVHANNVLGLVYLMYNRAHGNK